jgi:hypothetical protein
MSNVDIDRARHELIRWIALTACEKGRPYPVAEPLILSIMQSVPVECTALELRRELGYLEDRGLVRLNKLEGAPWTAKLTRTGVDVVDYTAPVEPGIARPKKYW